MDEAGLVRKLQRGESEAFEPLYRHHVNQAVRVAYLICGSQRLAEDVAYEAFVQVLRSVHTLHNPQLFRSWFYRILIDAARQRKAGRWSFTVPWLRRETGDCEESPLSRLPDQELISLVLSCYVEMTESEIAQVLSLPQGAVGNLLERARLKLGKSLTGAPAIEPGLEGGSARADR